MNIEEKLWNYIDGSCTPDEQRAIELLIASDEAARLKYKQLVAFNADLTGMELDEPPMAFTYHVMEAIRTEQAQKPLKSAINKRIILGIALFFWITILALLVFTFANVKLSPADIKTVIPGNVRLPDTQSFFTRPVINGFLFVDLVTGLFFFDTWLRRKKKLSGIQ